MQPVQLGAGRPGQTGTNDPVQCTALSVPLVRGVGHPAQSVVRESKEKFGRSGFNPPPPTMFIKSCVGPNETPVSPVDCSW